MIKEENKKKQNKKQYVYFTYVKRYYYIRIKYILYLEINFNIQALLCIYSVEDTPLDNAKTAKLLIQLIITISFVLEIEYAR